MKARNTALVITLLCVLAGCTADPQAITSDDVDLLNRRLAELEAREHIRELFMAYGRFLDNRDYQSFATLFTDTATYGGGGGQMSHGAEAIAAQLESVISANASGANLHVFSNEKIEVDIASGTARAISRGAFYVENETAGPMPLMFATYLDELVLDEGIWKFQSRQVIGDLPGPANESREPLTL